MGKLSNGYLIHEVVLARCKHALSVLLQPDKLSIDIERRNPIEKNTALNLAVAICDADMVEVGHVASLA